MSKSEKEKLFENHICEYLQLVHDFIPLESNAIEDKQYHFINSQLLNFIRETQTKKYEELQSDYGSDTDNEIITALKNELEYKPLWLLMRDGLMVKSREFQLYLPKPRSQRSQSEWTLYRKNIFSFKQQYYFDETNDQSIDFVIFLNGLPIITTELKHQDEGQYFSDAVTQYTQRNQSNLIFQLPFLHIAADTQDVKVSTNPSQEQFFQWFNGGLENKPEGGNEYPIEHLYKHALSKDKILAYLEYYLIYVPVKQHKDEYGEMVLEPAFSIFPRYHQLRATNKLSEKITTQYEEYNALGKKYLIYHSAGSGKTLTIAWLADRLYSLHNPSNDVKVFDIIFVLTDRRSLDKNIKDDLLKFRHLSEGTSPVVNFTDNSGDLEKFITKRKSIIVTTIQKFSYIQDIIAQDEELRKLHIAFLIDEAQRSQEGKLSYNMLSLFKNKEVPDEEQEGETEEERISKKLATLNISNHIFVAFSATPTAKTIAAFGDPVDTYYEDEAIKDGYILDVADSIISYKTLYNLNSKIALPDNEYPKGLVAKALRNVAYCDEGLIRYKSEIIIKYFEERVHDLINGKAKAMVVASSRPAGLIYFNTLKEIISAKNLRYKVLYAFSDFKDENGNDITEDKVNELTKGHNGNVIEDVFAGDEFRILVVANKFQVGFNQPLLAAMFLDKVVNGVNAIQTISRLNRNHADKDETIVLDFTNNSEEIFKAFNQYRKSTPYLHADPDPSVLQNIYNDILAFGVFSEEQVTEYVKQIFLAEDNAKKSGNRDATQDARLQQMTVSCREQFHDKVQQKEERKKYISLLVKFVKLYYFLANFYDVEKYSEFNLFAGAIADKLLRTPTQVSFTELIKNVYLEKGVVKFISETHKPRIFSEKDPTTYKTKAEGGEIVKISIPDFLDELRTLFPISNEDAAVIHEIQQEQIDDPSLRQIIFENKNNELFLKNYVGTIEQKIITAYFEKNAGDKIEQEFYKGKGGIIHLMATKIINILSRKTA